MKNPRNIWALSGWETLTRGERETFEAVFDRVGGTRLDEFQGVCRDRSVERMIRTFRTRAYPSMLWC